MIAKALYARARTDWETPHKLFGALHQHYAFNLDVCALPSNTKLSRFFTPEQNGLTQSWSGQRCWLNPPYGRGVGAWVKKAAMSDAQLVLALLPARTDTRWWHDFVQPYAARVTFLRGRLRFVGAASSAPFPSVLVLFENTPWVRRTR